MAAERDLNDRMEGEQKCVDEEEKQGIVRKRKESEWQNNNKKTLTRILITCRIMYRRDVSIIPDKENYSESVESWEEKIC